MACAPEDVVLDINLAPFETEKDTFYSSIDFTNDPQHSPPPPWTSFH